MTVSRRSLLAVVPIASLSALAACSLIAPSSPGGTQAQIIADTTGALNGLANTIPGLAASKPPVLSATEADSLLSSVNEARSLLAAIGPDTPAQTGATELARIEGILTSALTVLSASPLPPSLALIVAAASVILPELSAYVSEVTKAPPSPAAAKIGAKGSKGMSLPKARRTLGVAE